MQRQPDGLIAVVKQDCPTCTLVEPVLRQLDHAEPLTVYTQDNPQFPAGVRTVIDDLSLEHSYRMDIEVVPTLLRFEKGKQIAQAIGWHRGEWETVSGIANLGEDLPETRPGCGSRSVEPGIAEKLAVQFGESTLAARRVDRLCCTAC